MSRLQNWIDEGRHLPTFMRDFHDQKDLFKTMYAVQGRPEELRHISWVNAHCFVIDCFLWYMARRGYTLQKSRAKQDFMEFKHWRDVRPDLPLPTPKQVADLNR